MNKRMKQVLSPMHKIMEAIRVKKSKKRYRNWRIEQRELAPVRYGPLQKLNQ